MWIGATRVQLTAAKFFVIRSDLKILLSLSPSASPITFVREEQRHITIFIPTALMK